MENQRFLSQIRVQVRFESDDKFTFTFFYKVTQCMTHLTTLNVVDKCSTYSRAALLNSLNSFALIYGGYSYIPLQDRPPCT